MRPIELHQRLEARILAGREWSGRHCTVARGVPSIARKHPARMLLGEVISDQLRVRGVPYTSVHSIAV